MPNIIYYSSNCDKCIKLLSAIGNKKLENTLYFSVDKRENVDNQTYLILENGSRVLLPLNITSVPSLLIIDENTNKNTLKKGNEIYSYLNINISNSNSNSNINNTNNIKDEEDISCYSLNSKPEYIVSDTFSYIETSADDLLAEGDGGLSQLHNYSTLDAIHKIHTPKDNYLANTIGNDNKSIDDFKKDREAELRNI